MVEVNYSFLPSIRYALLSIASAPVLRVPYLIRARSVVLFALWIYCIECPRVGRDNDRAPVDWYISTKLQAIPDTIKFPPIRIALRY